MKLKWENSYGKSSDTIFNYVQDFVDAKNKQKDIIQVLGDEGVNWIYEYSDVFHCEPIEKVANDFIGEYKIPNGSFDNVAECRYLVPSYRETI